MATPKREWSSPLVARVADLAASKMASFEDSHGFSHAVRVHGLALSFARALALPPPSVLIVELGALCHDVVDHKFVTGTDARDVFARELGAIVGDEGVEAKVLTIVDGTSWSKDFRGERFVEMDVVQDADRVEALGAVGVGRCFAYGGGRGRTLWKAVEHYEEKMAVMHRGMDDSTFLTKPGREMAEKRSRTMRDFFEDFRRECREAEEPTEG